MLRALLEKSQIAPILGWVARPSKRPAAALEICRPMHVNFGFGPPLRDCVPLQMLLLKVCTTLPKCKWHHNLVKLLEAASR
jgi:hypothetical protein